MLDLKPDQPRTLTFEVEVQGVPKEELRGYVRFMINDSEHGFPVEIGDGVITAEIPALTDVVKLNNVQDGDIIEAKLELMTERRIFVPWNDEIKITAPDEIKVRLTSESVESRPKKVVKSSRKPRKRAPKKKVVKESKKVVKKKVVKKRILEDDESYKDELVRLAMKTFDNIPKSESKTETLMEASEEERLSEIKNKDELVNKIKNITKEGVYKYMERAGTKNPKIQDLIYEQAIAVAGSDTPFRVLKEIVKILKKRRDL